MDEPRICAREGCTRYAPVDEFCCTRCAKIHNGVIPNVRRSSYVSKAKQFGPIDVPNEHVNIARHEGPQPRSRPRLRG